MDFRKTLKIINEMKKYIVLILVFLSLSLHSQTDTTAQLSIGGRTIFRTLDQLALSFAGASYTFSTGLTDASSTITANLSTGVSGGQSVVGGTASGNGLTLSSTSNATKGKILFGTSAYDEANNRLGIGTASPTYPITNTYSDAGTGTIIGFHNNITSTPASNKAAATYGASYQLTIAGSNYNLNALGFQSQVLLTGTNSSNIIKGFLARVSSSGTGAANSITGGEIYLEHGSSGIIASAAYGLRIIDLVNSGTINNTYAIRIDDITTGTQSNQAYGIYQTDVNARNYFGGTFGVGTTSPDRLFHVENSDAVTNAVTYANRFSHITSGTAAANFGTGSEYELENASGTNVIAATDEITWSDATNASEDATFTKKLMRAGTLTTAMTILSTGETTFTGQLNTQNVYPVTDDAYYIGKNDDDTPFAYKGVILKDQVTGTYYRIEILSGVLTVTDLTD